MCSLCLHVNCVCTIGTCLKLNLWFSVSNVMLELGRTAASQNHHSCRFADKRAKRGYYNKSNVVLCVK